MLLMKWPIMEWLLLLQKMARGMWLHSVHSIRLFVSKIIMTQSVFRQMSNLQRRLENSGRKGWGWQVKIILFLAF